MSCRYQMSDRLMLKTQKHITRYLGLPENTQMRKMHIDVRGKPHQACVKYCEEMISR